ncbi:MAG: DUF512 domain-containing protein [Limnochordaceae bacterium]|nr:DUF512 domain-containing protein [Limnochordaceae bacterium]
MPLRRNPKAALKPGAIVSEVRAGSLADEAGIRPGDQIVAINGVPASDLVQLHYAAAQDRVDLEVRRPDGETWVVEIEKDEDEDLGLRFSDPLFDRIVTCVNRCIFCFVHQSPKGMRRTLYIMDDDLRLSFLDGNFVTLTNWTESDWQRVLEQHLSPLYVSVHSTEDDLRAFLMGTDAARGILGQLRRLAAAGIQVHTQLVLCPGINDGEHLDRSIADLAALYPHVRSIAVVPVGLTRFRQRLHPLRPYRAPEAAAVLRQVHAWQRRLLQHLGTRLVFPADEWYSLAGRWVPPREAYEDFPQLSNGIGLVRRLLDEFYAAEAGAVRRQRGSAGRLPGGRRVLWVTGTSARPFLEALARRLERRHPGLEVRVHPVVNQFYGPTVTVAGLLTGADIRASLERLPDLGRFDAVYVPNVALKADEPVFLDDMPLRSLREGLPAPVEAIDVDGQALWSATTGAALTSSAPAG